MDLDLYNIWKAFQVDLRLKYGKWSNRALRGYLEDNFYNPGAGKAFWHRLETSKL